MMQRIISSLKKLVFGKFLLTLLVVLTASSTLHSQFDTFNDAWRWVHFTIESGLPSNHLTSIVEAKDGTTWAATSAGLAYYDGFRWVAVGDTFRVLQQSPSWIVPDTADAVLAIF